ncbi:MAG: single-stranded DNA-binding protein [Solibacillus sp.]
MNQVGLVGRITKDPMLRQLTDGSVINFVIAVSRTFRNSQGTVDADFVQCVAWGKSAEHIAKYCGKGSLIGVKGHLQTRTYVNKENQKVYATEVFTEGVRFYVLKSPEGLESLTTGEARQAPPNFELPEEDLPIVPG